MKLSILDQVRITPDTTSARALESSIELAQVGDELGYERYWIAEHHGPSLACSCPEVLLARIGCETSTIRIGAGGILLPHYSPLKVTEIFRTLAALYPGRIDLGVGRAQGCGDLEAEALKRYRVQRPFADDFSDQLTELLCFLRNQFSKEHPFYKIIVSPQISGELPIWLLGSTISSAALAAELGLPYAFAQFISPTTAQESIGLYHLEFERKHKRPGRTILAVGAICMESETKVQELIASLRENRQMRPGTNPAQANPPNRPISNQGNAQRHCYVGTSETVRSQLLAAAASSRADELMVLAPFGDHRICLKSYELLADAFELKPTTLICNS